MPPTDKGTEAASCGCWVALLIFPNGASFIHVFGLSKKSVYDQLVDVYEWMDEREGRERTRSQILREIRKHHRIVRGTVYASSQED
jgi:hypothetical protein